MEGLNYSNSQMRYFQFLTVCQYVNSFGIFFNNENLIPHAYQDHTVYVLNTLFEYVKNSKNESKAKLELLRRALNGSDLYGGDDDETLDPKYIDETYQRIISIALFSQYGNIHGFLSRIIYRARNTTYLALKENVFNTLSKNYHPRDYCSLGKKVESKNINLTSLTVDELFHKYLWAMFPEPKENTDILNVNYIQAMIGLKLARSVRADIGNLSFENFILLGQLVGLQSWNNSTYQLMMDLYATPVIFYHAIREKERFRERLRATWPAIYQPEMYREFLSYLNFWQEKFMNVELKTILYYRMKHLRRQLREKDENSLANILQYEEEQILRQMSKNSLEQLFVDANLMGKFKSNASVEAVEIFSEPRACHTYIPEWKYSTIFIIFAVMENGRKDFYALKQDGNAFTLYSNRSEEELREVVKAENFTQNIKVSQFYKILKHSYQSCEQFIRNFAEFISWIFAISLTTLMNSSQLEALNMLHSSTPYYTCLEGANPEDDKKPPVLCNPVVKNLLPIPQFNDNVTSIVWKSLIIEMQQQTLSSTLKPFGNNFNLSNAFKQIKQSLKDKFFTQETITRFNKTNIQAWFAGFELSFQISNSSNELFSIMKKIFSTLSNIGNLRSAMNSAFNTLDKNVQLQRDQFELRRRTKNTKNTFRYYYPGGSHYFGPLCIAKFGRTAEFRTVEGIPYKIPVSQTSIVNRKPHYNLYNPKVGDLLLQIEFEMKNNNCLLILSKSGQNSTTIRELSEYYKYETAANIENREKEFIFQKDINTTLAILKLITTGVSQASKTTLEGWDF